MDLTQSETVVSPVAIAGLLLAARSWQQELGLPHCSVEDILGTTEASRSRAYELRSEILEQIPRLVRRPGRPSSQPRSEPPAAKTSLTQEVLRFVIDHPGCVHGRSRRRYSDEFRHHVLELRERYSELDLGSFAEAICVPLGTLEDWLRGPSQRDPEPAEEPPTSPTPSLEHEATIPQVETILHEWRHWRGKFIPFCEHLRLHCRIPLGRTLIAKILEIYGERTPERRGRRNSDEDALRRSFETFFPGAQWVGDGTQVKITLDGTPYTFNFELMADASSSAWLGTSIRDEEDSAAVVEAFEQAVETAQDQPIAVLLDNRPSNHTEEVEEALGDTLLIPSTPGRAQNKAHAEGAFGLFKQKVPPLEFSTHDPRELARGIVRRFVDLFARVLNHRPRRDRDGKSRADLHANSNISEEDKANAKEALQERLRKQELARQTRQARLDPVVKDLLDRAFERLDLLDPKRNIRDAIACYPLDDIVDAIAIFDGKRHDRNLPKSADARYLLGIVRNLHHVHEADSITNALVCERLHARDQILAPLIIERDRILRDDRINTLNALVDRAMTAERAIDRLFFLHGVRDFIRSHTSKTHSQLFRKAAARIHNTFATPPRERSKATRILARQLWPLA